MPIPELLQRNATGLAETGLRAVPALEIRHLGLVPVHIGSFQLTDSSGCIEGGTHTRKIVNAASNANPDSQINPGIPF